MLHLFKRGWGLSKSKNRHSDSYWENKKCHQLVGGTPDLTWRCRDLWFFESSIGFATLDVVRNELYNCTN